MSHFQIEGSRRSRRIYRCRGGTLAASCPRTRGVVGGKLAVRIAHEAVPDEIGIPSSCRQRKTS